MLEKKLELLRGLQNKYPDLHVGGSIGLLLHGIDLKRPIDDSDLDLVKSSDEKNLMTDGKTDEPISKVEDFNYSIEFDGLRVDVKIDRKQSYVYRSYNGHTYKVSQIEQILFYKCKYALKGVDKHKNDIHVLMGVITNHPEPELAF